MEVTVKLRSIAVASFVALALAIVGSAVARPSAARAKTVNVTAKDFSFTLSPKTVHHGRVMFVIKNDGQTAHDFAIAGHVSKLVSPGKKTTLTVTLKRGSIAYRCTIDSHARMGMKGVLHVT
jgi:uncharacterized cupredoxin-like copper-binding protein